jgi:tetratricopeptide (TPR) repeat protein
MNNIRDSIIRLVLPAIMISLLLGCKMTPKPSTAVDKSNAAVSQYQVQPGLAPRQRFAKALQFLATGKASEARAELHAYLKAIPQSSSAEDLLRQINTPGNRYFPEQSFDVQLTSGQSLSTLAHQYLGSTLKFYALAKYNGIDDPSRVNIGQTIKIPHTKQASNVRQHLLANKQAADSKPGPSQPVVAIKQAADSKSGPSQPVVAIKQAVDSKPGLSQPAVMIKQAIKPTPQAILQETPNAPVDIQATPDELIASITNHNKKGDYAAAMSDLNALQAFGELTEESRQPAITALLGDANQQHAKLPARAAADYAQVAALELQNNQDISAFEHLKKAQQLAPKDAEIGSDYRQLQKQLANKYHREASSAFRRQQLDIAITKWDKVLEIDPDFSSAKLYREQALELKAKLQKIKQ